MPEIGRLLSAAQKILSIYQDKLIDNEAHFSILLAANTIESLLEKVKEENEIYWQLDAAIAYSMIGEFKESRRILDDININFFQNKSGFLVAIATIDPSKISLMNWKDLNSPFRDYIKLIDSAFNQGLTNDFHLTISKLKQLLNNCLMKNEDSLANSLLRGCRPSLKALISTINLPRFFYLGHTFVPIGSFHQDWNDLARLVRSIGINKYKNQEDWSYQQFYVHAQEANCDDFDFYLMDWEQLVVPGEMELFGLPNDFNASTS